MFRSMSVLMVVCMMGSLVGSTEGQCVLSEPATSVCGAARVIPGTPGQHVVLMDVVNSTAVWQPSCSGLQANQLVWFTVTPTVTGPITLSTCHPATGFDTAIIAFTGGDTNCVGMSETACSDDVLEDRCDNGCSFYGSEVTIDATAGQTYRFMVAAIDFNQAGCPTCLGVVVTIGDTCGSAPTNIGPCDAAMELPGSPGSYEILQDVTDAVVLPNEPQPSCTEPDVGKTVWYHFSPTDDSRVEFSTCHPNTSYDTVVQVYAGNGICTGGFFTNVACSDDSDDPACISGCSPNPRSSKVTFDALAGGDYWIQVGAYSDNSAGCELCLGSVLSIFDCNDPLPPTVSLTMPPELGAGCACNPVQVVGSAFDPGGAFDSYLLDYRQTGATAWTTIVEVSGEAVNEVLADWDTTALPQGYYLLRLTAKTKCGQVDSTTHVLYLDGGFDTVDLRYPPPPGAGGPLPVVAGNVCLDGTVFESWCWHPNTLGAHFKAEYRADGAGNYSPVDPAQPTYVTTIVNDPIASWDTLATGIPDGQYQLRITAINDCGTSSEINTGVIVDNTPPTAIISSVSNCDYVGDTLQVIGTAVDANIAGWALQYTGGNTSEWVTIGTGAGNVPNGVLGTWDTSQLPSCAYTLRLIVTDQAVIGCGGPLRHRTSHMVSLNVGFCGDFDADDDGDVDLVDFGAFQDEFTGPLP